MKTDSMDKTLFADKLAVAGYQYGEDATENAFVGYNIGLQEMADAYHGAREDCLTWRNRALTAEAALVKLNDDLQQVGQAVKKLHDSAVKLNG